MTAGGGAGHAATACPVTHIRTAASIHRIDRLSILIAIGAASGTPFCVDIGSLMCCAGSRQASQRGG